MWAGHWRMDTSEMSEVSDLHASSSLLNLSPSQHLANLLINLISWGFFLSFKLIDKHLLLTPLGSKSSILGYDEPLPLSMAQLRLSRIDTRHSKPSCYASHKPPTCTLAKLFVIKPSKTRRIFRLPDWGNSRLCKFQTLCACTCRVLNAFVFRISLPLWSLSWGLSRNDLCQAPQDRTVWRPGHAPAMQCECGATWNMLAASYFGEKALSGTWNEIVFPAAQKSGNETADASFGPIQIKRVQAKAESLILAKDLVSFNPALLRSVVSTLQCKRRASRLCCTWYYLLPWSLCHKSHFLELQAGSGDEAMISYFERPRACCQDVPARSL